VKSTGFVEMLRKFFKCLSLVFFMDRASRLRKAVRDGETAKVMRLLDRGVDPNVGDDEGCTALHLAANFSPEIVRILVERGANVNARCIYGLTPLHHAGSLEIAVFLVEHGADVNARDKNGRTPLHSVALFNMEDIEIARFLISRGAEVDARDASGRTPLHYAAEHGYTGLIKLLAEKGADINIQDKDGRTPLHLAATSGREKAVTTLLGLGADPNIRDNEGLTPGELATNRGHTDLAELIRNYGRKSDKAMDRV
jgi:ankyrin repeat protein